MNRKGIVLAGGAGSRMHPITNAISKQLIPVYDKPLVYYPISTLMLAGIKDILVITTEKDEILFKNLLGNGSEWGIKIQYKTQSKPNGIAEAFIIGEEFIGSDPVALILGDNIFYGDDLVHHLTSLNDKEELNTVFAYPVSDPERYGVVSFDDDGKVSSIEEKPKNPKSRYAVTGLYFYNNEVINIAKSIKPSHRGELEITSINQEYLKKNSLKVEIFGRGMAWLDTGTHDSLLEASQFIATLEKRQGFKIGCPEEIAWRKGWISDKALNNIGNSTKNSPYGQYLLSLLDGN